MTTTNEKDLVNVTNVGVADYFVTIGEQRNHVAISLLVKASANVVVTLEAKIGNGPDWVDISKTAKDLRQGADGIASWTNQTTILSINGINVTDIRVKYAVSNAVNSLYIATRRL
jgi:hypothetical protein